MPRAPNELPGTVKEVVFRGPLRRDCIRLPHGGLWSVDEPAATETPAHARGAAVTVTWRPKTAARFRTNEGRRGAASRRALTGLSDPA